MLSSPKKKILVGLSGGVDSAVSAALLIEQGYDVIAGFMKNYADETNPNCHTREDRDMAMKVATHLGIKTFIIFDFRAEYDQYIVQYIYEGYEKGLTPNPDVLCNSLIKFDLFLEQAKQLGCDGIATGHYARIMPPLLSGEGRGEGYQLLKGIDTNKDQSYFLAGLTQEQLAGAHFPIGELTKPEVRALAVKYGLPNADRKDSQGLCFIGNVPMKEFLSKKLASTQGQIKDTLGHILGTHPGALYYTIGQREGLGLSGGPRFVVEKDVKNNELIVGHEDDTRLWTTQVNCTDRHRIGEIPELPKKAQVKLRYRQPDQVAHLDLVHDMMQITFEIPQKAATPGQIAVAYEGDILLGSGVIL